MSLATAEFPLLSLLLGHRLALHWRKVLLIAILAGLAPREPSGGFSHWEFVRLEKNLTNSSLSHIGGALKTAMPSSQQG